MRRACGDAAEGLHAPGPPSRQVFSLAVLPDGSLACGTSEDKKVTVIDMRGEVKLTKELGGWVGA